MHAQNSKSELLTVTVVMQYKYFLKAYAFAVCNYALHPRRATGTCNSYLTLTNDFLDTDKESDFRDSENNECGIKRKDNYADCIVNSERKEGVRSVQAHY